MNATPKKSTRKTRVQKAAAKRIAQRKNVRATWEQQQRAEAQRLHRGLRIVGDRKNCPVCHQQAPDIPATQKQAEAWFGSRDVSTFMKFQQMALLHSLHRECIPAWEAKQEAKRVAAERKAERAELRKQRELQRAKEVVVKRVKARKATRKAAVKAA